MIPFGSQRGNGADLATHLANAEDNEFVEIAELRGVIADDLQGAFAEMEAKASALTNMTKPFYSLSINPDPRQPWSREMYMEYRERAEIALGLSGHDRATVFHIKHGRDGILREHCHIVWNRTDVANSNGVNIAFDRLKLMSLTREYAAEKGLRLPSGYYKIDENHEQASLYEKTKESQTGISKEKHKSVVTDLWRTSDSPKAFVAALEDHGYMLAQGKRPYVLVDTFGKMHALPRLIDDKQVRTSDVEAFLKDDFPPHSLSTVDEAKAVAKEHEASRARIAQSERLAHQIETLKRDQSERRAALSAKIAEKLSTQREREKALKSRHSDDLKSQRLTVAQQNFEIDFKRAAHAPKGLSEFLSRITGMDIIRTRIHAYQDRKREATQDRARREIEDQHKVEAEHQKQEDALEMLELRRLEAEQIKSFAREARSVEMVQNREKVAHHSRDYPHMPSVQLTLTPRGSLSSPKLAARRHYSPAVKDANAKVAAKQTDAASSADERQEKPRSQLSDIFTDAAADLVRRNSGDSDFIAPEHGKDTGHSR